MKIIPFSLTIIFFLVIQFSYSQVRDSDSLTEIGYGEIQTEYISSALDRIDEDQFNPGFNITTAELIVGKTPGILITRESGAPGSEFDVTIRGKSSLFTDNNPLYVVNGIPLDYRANDGMRNILNFINPGDIESFTILKDAAATGIYGGRASNGVILINTKKGCSNQPLSIHYEGKLSINTARKRTVLSADEFSSLVQSNGTLNDISMLGSANTNWQDEIYQNGVGQDHLLSLAGGIKKLPYRVSVGYTNQDGVLKTDNLSRITTALDINPRFFKDHLGIGFGMNSMHSNNQIADQSAILNAIGFDPTQPVYNEDGSYGGYFYWKDEDGLPNGLAPANPVAKLDQISNKAKVSRYFWQFNLDYKFHFLPDLSIRLRYAQDQIKSERDYKVSENTAFNWAGYDNSYNQKRKTRTIEALLAYNKIFQKINSQLDIVVGFTPQSFENTEDYMENSTYFDTTLQSYGSLGSSNNFSSLFGRVNFSLKQKYLFGITFRRDGSSIYSEDNRWSNYPTISIGWNMHNERFLVDSNTWSVLKLRASYGKTGNMSLRSIPFFSTYPDHKKYSYSPYLIPEKTTSFNVGIDYGFLNHRIYGSLDFYVKKTDDLIVPGSPPPGVGWSSLMLSNYGSIRNTGLEFSITGKIIDKAKVLWQINYNISYNKNEILELSPLTGSYPAGEIFGGVGNYIQIHKDGNQAYSFYVLQQIYDGTGKPVEGLYVDKNQDGSINSLDRYTYKNPLPNVHMGFSSYLKVKNWDFSFLATIRLGNYNYNNIDSYYGAYEQLSPINSYLNALSPNVSYTQFEENQYWSNYYVQKASFLKLNNLMAGYNFTSMMGGTWGIRIYVTAQNLFTVSSYEGPEPEIIGGIDYYTYPSPRIYMLGVQVNLN